MNKRLECIRALIEEGAGVIDVGTDHGYLPAGLALSGYGGALFASDIGRGPLAAAERTARSAGVYERIRFLLSDGLDACPPQAVDTIVIAGMGGDLICRILDRAEWCMDGRYKLILQPMTKPEVLRYWLVNNGFGILREELTEDAGRLYQVLAARFGGCTRLSDAELFTGSFALPRDRALFDRLLDLYIRRMEKALAGLRASAAPQPGRAELLEAVWEQLKKEKNYENRL